MPSLIVEFLLTDKPLKAEIEFERGSTLEDVLYLIEKKLPDPRMFGTRDFFSSVIITHNERIGDPKRVLRDGDRLKIFHLVDGG
jgi:sulfur carrier protein ThiS